MEHYSFKNLQTIVSRLRPYFDDEDRRIWFQLRLTISDDHPYLKAILLVILAQLSPWCPESPFPDASAPTYTKQAIRAIQDMILEHYDINKSVINNEVISDYIFGTGTWYRFNSAALPSASAGIFEGDTVSVPTEPVTSSVPTKQSAESVPTTKPSAECVDEDEEEDDDYAAAIAAPPGVAIQSSKKRSSATASLTEGRSGSTPLSGKKPRSAGTTELKQDATSAGAFEEGKSGDITESKKEDADDAASASAFQKSFESSFVKEGNSGDITESKQEDADDVASASAFQKSFESSFVKEGNSGDTTESKQEGTMEDAGVAEEPPSAADSSWGRRLISMASGLVGKKTNPDWNCYVKNQFDAKGIMFQFEDGRPPNWADEKKKVDEGGSIIVAGLPILYNVDDCFLVGSIVSWHQNKKHTKGILKFKVQHEGGKFGTYEINFRRDSTNEFQQLLASGTPRDSNDFTVFPSVCRYQWKIGDRVQYSGMLWKKYDCRIFLHQVASRQNEDGYAEPAPAYLLSSPGLAKPFFAREEELTFLHGPSPSNQSGSDFGNAG